MCVKLWCLPFGHKGNVGELNEQIKEDIVENMERISQINLMSMESLQEVYSAGHLRVDEDAKKVSFAMAII